MDLRLLGLAVGSYLAGGIPTGYLAVKKLKGFDIRDYGSGNPGTANVYRVAGPMAGAITLFVDSLKGFFPVLLARHLYPDSPAIPILCGALAIIGHVWTVFLGFRGGKGVATSAGVFAALMPKATAGAAAVFALGFWLSGHISVGSMAAATVLPILNVVFGGEPYYTAMAGAACALILFKHIPNLKRLLSGKELHLNEKKS